MLVEIVGIHKLNFTKNGTAVEGTKLHCFDNNPNPDLIGKAVETFFIKKEVELPKGLQVGDTVDIRFNKYGKPEAVVK